MNSSLEVSDQAAAAVAVAPRVTLDDIKAAIAEEHYGLADEYADGVVGHPALGLMTLCFLVMKNGFVVVGKSAPASPDNFDAELGKQFAYEDAVRQLWPLMGFHLRSLLHEREQARGC